MNGKILMLVFGIILLVGTISAGEISTWDNVLNYKKDDMKVSIINTLGLEILGTIELKSHTSVDQVLEFGFGKEEVVIYYDFTGWELYKDGLGEVYFTNLNTGKEIQKDYYFVEWILKDVVVNDYKEVCGLDLNNTISCEKVISGTHLEKKGSWERLETKDIKNKRIGLKTYVGQDDYIDAVWTIAGKKIKRHASWTANLDVDLEYYYKLDETAGTSVREHVTGLNGTADNARVFTTSVSGIVNTGADFWEADYVNISNTAQISNNHTLSFWVEFNAVGDGVDEYVFYAGTDTADTQDIIRNYDVNKLELYSDAEHRATLITTPVANTWYHIVLIKTSATNLDLYVDGSSVGSLTTDAYTGVNFDYFGNHAGGVLPSNSTIDEIGIWSRALTSAEITQLYGRIQYGVTAEKPIVTLNFPIDTYNTTSLSITFNATASDDINLVNVSLYLDGIINETNSSGFNDTYYYFTKTFDDGNYNWTIKAYDNDTQSTTATTRTFTIDTIDPVINITSPLNQSVITTFNPTYNVSFNATITDANLDNCWYNNETANVTVTCGDNTTINLGEGYHTLIWYANDSVGHEVSNSTTFFINYIQYNVTFADPVIEGETDLVTFNLTTTNIDNLTAILEYNNINYTMTGTNNNTYGEFNYTITAPIIASNTEVPLKVYYKLNGVNYTSIDYNQSVYFINPIEVAVSCSAGLSAAMYFNFTDAQNLTTIQNATINYNFKMGISNTSQKITFGSLTNIDEFYLCINSSIYNNYSLGHGEISYFKEGWSIRRWYAFNNQRLSNTTINNSLYLLASRSATSFLVTIQDPTLTAYPDIYTSLLRWYPSLDDYKVVEMGRTDNKGQTIKKIEVEDVDYRIGIYEQNGTLIYLASPIRMICIASPCTYTLTVISVSGVEYSNFLGVKGELVYTDGVFLYTYNDPSQTTSSIYLNVTRVSGNNEILLCQDTSSSFTGVLTCNVTGEQGLLKGVVFRSASPAKAIAVLWIDNLNTVFQSPMGLFFVMIIVLTLFLVGIYYPIASIILGILALVPALFLRVIIYPIFIGIAVLAGIVIHFMRETR